MEADIACITETWLVDKHEQIREDICNRTSYSMIVRNREGRRGGGVCIIYNKTHVTMAQCKLPESEFEVVAAIGRRTAQRRKVLTIAAYLPPQYNAERTREFLSYLCDCILLLKNKYNDPYIVIAGDFNKRNLSQATKDYPRIKPIKTPPLEEV